MIPSPRRCLSHQVFPTGSLGVQKLALGVMLFPTSFQMSKRPSSLPHLCCCFKAFTGCERPSSQPHQCCCFDAFQAKNVQAHYHTTHRVAVSMPLWRRTSKLTITTPVLLFQSLYRLRTSKLTTHTTVLLFRYLSGKERPSSLQQNTQCYSLNAVWRRTSNAHYFRLQHKYIL